MVMFSTTPMLPSIGVPERRPVVSSNSAHVGRLLMLNVSVSPSGSEAVGVNEYASLIVTDDDGVPVIVGDYSQQVRAG